MGTSTFAVLAGMGMFAAVAMIVVGVLLAALMLSVAFRLVVGYMPSYLRALGVVLLAAIAAVAVSVVLGILTGSLLHGGPGGLLSMAVQFLVGAALVNYRLPSQTGARIGFGKACLVELVYLVIGAVLAMAIGMLMMMVFGAAMWGMH